MREQRISGAVKLRHGDNVVSVFGDIDYRIVNRRHSRADAESFDATFESRDALFKNGVGGIAYARVDIALNFEIEQGGAVLRAVKLKRDSLIDRNRDGFRVGVAVLAGVECDGFSFHVVVISD